MSNVRFDELELMLMAMFEQPTLRDTIQVLTEAQPLVAEDARVLVLRDREVFGHGVRNGFRGADDRRVHGKRGGGESRAEGRGKQRNGEFTNHESLPVNWIER